MDLFPIFWMLPSILIIENSSVEGKVALVPTCPEDAKPFQTVNCATETALRNLWKTLQDVANPLEAFFASTLDTKWKWEHQKDVRRVLTNFGSTIQSVGINFADTLGKTLDHMAQEKLLGDLLFLK